MAPLVCPQCADALPDDGRCSQCELDATLVLRVRQAADRLAHAAAKHIADGQWQEAYDAATESLQLAQQDNDLAAFVLIVATLAGAQGTVSSVHRPRPGALPATLKPYVHDTLAVAERLRLLSGNASSVDDIEPVLRELDANHPLLSMPAPSSPEPPAPPIEPAQAPPPPPRTQWPLLTGAVSIALGIGLFAGWLATRGSDDTQNIAAQSPLPTVTAQAIQPVVVPPQPEPLEPWVRALHDLTPKLRNELSETAWEKGRRASKEARYDEARQYFELAAQGPTTSWYRPHALYYLGRAYQRLGRHDEAVAVYRRLQQESPRSDYDKDVRRFLAQLETRRR